jgi:hypothetical protein
MADCNRVIGNQGSHQRRRRKFYKSERFIEPARTRIPGIYPKGKSDRLERTPLLEVPEKAPADSPIASFANHKQLIDAEQCSAELIAPVREPGAHSPASPCLPERERSGRLKGWKSGVLYLSQISTCPLQMHFDLQGKEGIIAATSSRCFRSVITEKVTVFILVSSRIAHQLFSQPI